MSSKSSGFRVKRSLSFTSRELPYAGKTFYIDVKSGSLKSKLSQRILNLGGQIENFLSKDLSLLITDKCEEVNNKTDDEPQKSTLKPSIPLSRGQALLLKASGQTNPSLKNKNHGLVHSASKLGVTVQTSAHFMHVSSKLLSKVKTMVESSKPDDLMCGMSPILWDEDKENMCVIKVEDEDKLFRPLLKHFEKFPEICYNESGSPFDVGVVLTKHDENQQSKKKTTTGRVQLGGYCESCDHWYKCSLREHLNSNKHKKFTANVENFASLKQVTSSLPDIKNFADKLGLKTDDINKCISDNEANFYFNDNCKVTEVDGNGERMVQKEQFQSPRATASNSEIFRELVSNPISEIGSHKSDNSNSCRLLHKQSKDSQRYSIDDVLRNLTDDEGGTKIDDENMFNGIYSINDQQPNVNFLGTGSQSYDSKSKTNDCKTRIFGFDIGGDANKENTTRTTHIPFPSINPNVSNFSSSSFSFGDNGVDKVISLLNNDSGSQTSESLNLNTVINMVTSRDDQKSKHLEAVESDNKIVTEFTNCVSQIKHSQASTCSVNGIPGCEKEELQIDINVGRCIETDSGLNDDRTVSVTDKKSAVGVPFPEYSNITEDSNQSKPCSAIQNNMDMNHDSNLNFHCLSFDTDLFGKDVTPNKECMDSLKAKLLKENANSGSTIRNWLIPADDNASVASLGLNNTLIENDIGVANVQTCDNEEINHLIDVPANVNGIVETSDTSKVAAWIQSNIFDVGVEINPEKSVENTMVGDKHSEVVIKPDADTKNIDDVEMDESCSVRKYDDYQCMDNDSQSAWSDSGTSISDCTLPDFRASASRERNNVAENVETHPAGNKDGKDSDSVSVKSSLSSSVTSKGIKISGLSALKNDSSKTVDDHKHTVPSNNSNVWPAYKGNCDILQNDDSLAQSNMNKRSQNVPGSMYHSVNPTVNTSHTQMTSNLNHFTQHCVTKNLTTDTASVDRSKYGNQLISKERLPAMKSEELPPQNVLQSETTFQPSHVNSSCNEQTSLKQIGMISGQSNNAKYFPVQTLNSSISCIPSSTHSPGYHGDSMVDFLLSPGLQPPNYHDPELATGNQNAYHQYQQVKDHLDTQSPKMCASNTSSCSTALLQHTSHRIINTATSFLSPNSNFLAHGDQHQSASQSERSNLFAENSWKSNGSLSQSTLLSPSSSIHNGHLQTIDLSHIAEDNSSDFSNTFDVAKPKSRKTNKRTKTATKSSKKPNLRKSAILSSNTIEQTGKSMGYNNNSVNTELSCSTSPSVTGEHLPQKSSQTSHNQANNWKQHGIPMSSIQHMSPYYSSPSYTMKNCFPTNQQQPQIQNSPVIYPGRQGNFSMGFSSNPYKQIQSIKTLHHEGFSPNQPPKQTQNLQSGGLGNTSVAFSPNHQPTQNLHALYNGGLGKSSMTFSPHQHQHTHNSQALHSGGLVNSSMVFSPHQQTQNSQALHSGGLVNPPMIFSPHQQTHNSQALHNGGLGNCSMAFSPHQHQQTHNLQTLHSGGLFNSPMAFSPHQQTQNSQALHNGGLGNSSMTFSPYHQQTLNLQAIQRGGLGNTTMAFSPQQHQTQNLQGLHNAGSENSSAVYNTVQTGDMKLTFRKVPVIDTQQSKHDLTHYWNVRKAGDCRLVFSANVSGKRKAEETPTKCSFIDDSPHTISQPLSKRQRCLVY